MLALVGSDAELTCRFSPNASSEPMELRWFRQTRSPAVLLYRAGQEQEDQQMAEYRGRATLVTDGLPEGRATLRIRGVRVSDQGEYRCFFRDNDSSEEAAAHLKVAGGYTAGCDAQSPRARTLTLGTSGLILQITLSLKKGDEWEGAQLTGRSAERYLILVIFRAFPSRTGLLPRRNT